MKETNKLFFKIILLLFFTLKAQAESKILSVGSSDAKVTVKVFSSLTCPHCASFHKEIFKKLRQDFINEGLVRFEHHSFPLDLAALNAEIVVKCHVDNKKKFELLDMIYEKQKLWAVGSDINKINDSLKKIGVETNLTDKKIDKCLNDDKSQDEILNTRIEAQKKYKIQSTPTVLINEKKYSGKIEYKEFKRL